MVTNGGRRRMVNLGAPLNVAKPTKDSSVATEGAKIASASRIRWGVAVLIGINPII
uniref:Uncharacterized protein n=1 Tax=Solanum lycopersicum TaxID=4081 RepID=K4CSR5_SOLLC